MKLFDALGKQVYDFFIDYAEAGPDDRGRTVTSVTHEGVDGPDGAFTVVLGTGTSSIDVISSSSLFWDFENNQRIL